MKRMFLATLVCTLLAGLAPASSFALDFAGAGARIGYVDPEGSDGGIGLGGHLEFEAPNSYWHFRPNLLYWNADPVSGVNVNLDVFYHFGPQAKTVPYLGAGVGLDMVDVDGPSDGDTDPAMNFFGGLQFPASQRATLFVEGRYVLTDVNQAGIFFGFTAR